MVELLSRKEVCEKIGISERTLRRKIQELNIDCIGEMLPNGIESKKITLDDFFKIAESCKSTVKLDETTKSIAVMSAMKLELTKVQQDLTNKDLLLSEKDKLIELLNEDRKNLQEDKKFLQEQIDKLTATKAEPKGFFKRLFK